MLFYIAEVKKKRAKNPKKQKTKKWKTKEEFRKKFGITEFDVMVHSEYSIKSKVGKRFVFEKIVEEYYVKIYKIDYFYKNCKEKITVDNNGHENIPFRIDVYFSECNLALEVDEKGHVDRDLISEKKIQEA